METLSTVILSDNSTLGYRKLPSSYDLLQWVCYPLINTENNNFISEVQLAVSVEGKMQDVMVQKWYHDRKNIPDLKLAIHALELSSLSYNCSIKDALEDLVNGGEDISDLKEVKIKLELQVKTIKE